jgi:hypothetical protein
MAALPARFRALPRDRSARQRRIDRQGALIERNRLCELPGREVFVGELRDRDVVVGMRGDARA